MSDKTELQTEVSTTEGASLSDFLYKDFTHKAMIKQIVLSLHEPWMDAEDKLSLENMIVSSYGKGMDESIDIGIKNGYSAEHQEKMVLSIMNKSKYYR